MCISIYLCAQGLQIVRIDFHQLSHTDLLIAGAGPAGLLLAAAAARRGLTVTLVDPAPERSFLPTYALFADQLPAVLEDAVLARWPEVEVHTDQGVHALASPYVRLDSARANAALRAECGPKCTVLTDRAVAAHAFKRGFIIALSSGQTLRARRVVDASGHHPALLASRTAAHEQVALGATLRGEHGVRAAILMDLRGGDDTPPSFLYALPLSDEEIFVEETALITHATPSWRVLEDRLRARLAGLGWHGELEIFERCRIPMDPDLPDLGSDILGFGAAAGLVHPATGYQFATAVSLAEPLADVLAATLDRDVPTAARAAWNVLWPARRRGVRALLRFGARFVAALDRADQASFFDAFFRLPAPRIRAYLSLDASPLDIALAMFGVFTRLSPALRRRLARHALRLLTPVIRPVTGVEEV